MKVAYSGNFRPAHSTENGLAAGLRAEGHEVVEVQQDTTGRVDWLRAGLAADAVLVTSTWGWATPYDRAGFDELTAAGRPAASFTLDRFAGLDRERMVAAHPHFLAPTVITADPDHPQLWADHHIDHRFVAPAIDHRQVGRGVFRDDLACDVLFVGSVAGYHREHPRRQRIVEACRAVWGDRFKHVGDRTSIRGDALKDLYASARVVVGDSLSDGPESGYYSDRVPETLGRGGLLVHPWQTPVSEAYGQLFETWHGDDLVEMVRAVGAVGGWSGAERSERAADAVDLVGERHTWRNRAREIVTILEDGS